jgi:hypothetical protein
MPVEQPVISTALEISAMFSSPFVLCVLDVQRRRERTYRSRA